MVNTPLPRQDTPSRVRRSSRFYLQSVLARPRASQSALAREAGVTPGFVSAVIKGRKAPSPKLITAAERLTGLPASVLFAEVDA